MNANGGSRKERHSYSIHKTMSRGKSSVHTKVGLSLTTQKIYDFWVLTFLLCTGCDESFNSRFTYLDHVEEKHPEGSQRKRPTTPFQHVKVRKPLPPLKNMHSYQVVHLPIRQRRVTKEMRNSFGPWVSLVFSLPKLVLSSLFI